MSRSRGPQPASPGDFALETESEILAAWDALKKRNYFEEGIAMILVAETRSGTGRPEPGLAERFAGLACVLADRREPDAAGLLELIAASDLNNACAPIPYRA